MLNRLELQVTLVLALSFAPALCFELYAIAGSTNTNGLPQFEASLLRIEEGNGSVVVLQDLIKKADPRDEYDGLAWIDTNWDVQKAVLLRSARAGGGEAELVVVDLATAKVAKRCRLARFPVGLGPVQEFLADLPPRGLHFAAHGISVNAESSALLVTPLDEKGSCEGELITAASPAPFGGYVSDGSAGVGATGSFNYLTTGRLERRLRVRFGFDWIFLPFEIPGKWLEAVGDVRSSSIRARNRLLEVIAVSGGEPVTYRLLVHTRENGEWAALPTGVSLMPKIRAFGLWIAWQESSTAIDTARKGQSALNKKEEVQRPGSGGWRQTNSRWGKGAEAGLPGNGTALYTGNLHLFHAARRQHFVIPTQQGDSEILLVDDDRGVVYYRVLDEIYRTSLGSRGPGESVLVARSEAIRDVHWVFRTSESVK